MNADLVPSGGHLPAELARMETVDLRAELGRALDVTARHLVYLAQVWGELERRGEDLSGLRSGLWSYMPLIARGRLRPEIVVQYAGHAMLLRQISELVPEEQDRLLRDPTVLVLELRDGQWHEARVPISQLRTQQMRQVLVGGRIRLPDEQRAAARSNARRVADMRPRPRAGSAEAAVLVAQEISDGRQRLRRAPQQPRANLVVQLTAEERRTLDRRAKEAGVSLTALMYGALRSSGLLGSEVP